MIAYNNNGLYNIYVRKQADEALQEERITADTHKAIHSSKEVGFYTPNYFVRIGLAILTLIIVSFLLGFFGLLFGAFNSSFPAMLILVGSVCYIAAEVLIRKYRHYDSGVDNMLVWMAALLLCISIDWDRGAGPETDIGFSFVILVVCSALAMRFADKLLSIAATIALLCFSFYCYIHAGGMARTTAPFFMMLVSAALYFVSAWAINYPPLILYNSCLKYVNVVALLALFSSGNYYLVRELSNEMFHLHLRLNDPLPLGWFFWIWTFLLPFVYIGFGIRNKNITLIRVGVLLVVVAVLTFRYYHSVMPPEMAMLLGGAIVFAVSYSLIKYLQTPKKGFTFKPDVFSKNDPVAASVTGELFDKSKDIFLQK